MSNFARHNTEMCVFLIWLVLYTELSVTAVPFSSFYNELWSCAIPKQIISKIWKKNKNRSSLWPTYTTLTSTLCIFQYLPYVLSLSGSPLAALPSSFTFVWFCMCLLQWTHRAWRLSLLGLALRLWGITNGHSCWSCPSWHSCFINK